jgi:hypothetical protein
VLFSFICTFFFLSRIIISCAVVSGSSFCTRHALSTVTFNGATYLSTDTSRFTTWTHTNIVMALPPGTGAGLSFVVGTELIFFYSYLFVLFAFSSGSHFFFCFFF